MEKRSALQKAVLISVAAMAVAFAILTFVFHRLEGVKFEEGFLRVSAQADDPAATVYAGKVQGERVKITVTDCPDEQRTEVEVQVGDRVRDECAVETGLPPIQADQLGPVEHIRITRNGQLLFEGGYTAEHDMGWYDLEGNWVPFSSLERHLSGPAGDNYWDSYKTCHRDDPGLRTWAERRPGAVGCCISPCCCFPACWRWTPHTRWSCSAASICAT